MEYRRSLLSCRCRHCRRRCGGDGFCRADKGMVPWEERDLFGELVFPSLCRIPCNTEPKGHDPRAGVLDDAPLRLLRHGPSLPMKSGPRRTAASRAYGKMNVTGAGVTTSPQYTDGHGAPSRSDTLPLQYYPDTGSDGKIRTTFANFVSPNTGDDQSHYDDINGQSCVDIRTRRHGFTSMTQSGLGVRPAPMSTNIITSAGKYQKRHAGPGRLCRNLYFCHFDRREKSLSEVIPAY